MNNPYLKTKDVSCNPENPDSKPFARNYQNKLIFPNRQSYYALQKNTQTDKINCLFGYSF